MWLYVDIVSDIAYCFRKYLQFMYKILSDVTFVVFIVSLSSTKFYPQNFIDEHLAGEQSSYT